MESRECNSSLLIHMNFKIRARTFVGAGEGFILTPVTTLFGPKARLCGFLVATANTPGGILAADFCTASVSLYYNTTFVSGASAVSTTVVGKCAVKWFSPGGAANMDVLGVAPDTVQGNWPFATQIKFDDAPFGVPTVFDLQIAANLQNGIGGELGTVTVFYTEDSVHEAEPY